MSPTPIDDCSSSSDILDIPEKFICPISLEIMNDPVMNKCGQNYERASILQWLHRGNENCPLTRQPLSPSQLFPNNALKNNIQMWKRMNGMHAEKNIDEEKDDESFILKKYGMITLFADACNTATVAARREDEDIDDLAYLRELYNEVLEIVGTD